MATVNKDFRIKAGLVVEGANATVDGEDIITTGSSTDNLPEGASNLYFTAERAANAVADEISTAVSTAIDALDTDTIEEGETNLYFTNQRAIDAVGGSATDANTPDTVVKRDASGNFAATDVTVSEISFSDIGRIYEDEGDLVIASTVEGDDILIEADDIRLNAVDDIFLTAGSTSDVYVRGPGNIYLVGPAIFAAENEEGLNADKVATHGYVDNAITNIDLTFNSDEITEGSTNLYYTDARVDSHLSGTYPIGYDAGDISLAIGEGGGLTTDEGGLYINRTTVDAWYDAAGAATTAESNANDYTDTALGAYTPTEDLDVTVGGYGYLKSADLSDYATESYVGTAVSNAVDGLVDGAPGLLDTLNEIAAAIADDENYATTMTTALAGKQNELTAGTNISIVSDTISVTGLASTDISDFNTAALSATSSAYDAAGAAATAESNANDYTDTAVSNLSSVYEAAGSIQTAIDALTTDDIEEGEDSLYFTDERVIDAIDNSVINPSTVVVNYVSKVVADTQAVSTASTVTGLAWAKSEYRSAKLVVKAATATNSQVSEIMVTLDSSDNVAITEFGIVYTDEELASVTADVSGTDVRIRVTTLNASTDVTVVGTLLV